MPRNANLKIMSSADFVQNDLKTPLYHQIFLIIKDRILHGEYPDGSFLPSEFEISNAYSVSRITAKRALNALAEAGLAIRQQGRGTRVSYKGGGTIVSGSVQSLLDSIKANARIPPKVLSFEYVTASGEILSALQLPAGSIVQRAVRLGHAAAAPYSLLTTFVPASIAKSWTADDLSQKPLIALIEASGIKVQRAEQIISATLADNQAATLLEVSVGAPLLRVVRTIFSDKNVPISYLVALYPPDRYKYMMTLTRGDDAHEHWT